MEVGEKKKLEPAISWTDEGDGGEKSGKKKIDPEKGGRNGLKITQSRPQVCDWRWILRKTAYHEEKGFKKSAAAGVPKSPSCYDREKERVFG